MKLASNFETKLNFLPINIFKQKSIDVSIDIYARAFMLIAVFCTGMGPIFDVMNFQVSKIYLFLTFV